MMEIFLFQPYFQKKISLERGRVWEQTAEILNGKRQDKILLKVSQWFVLDQFNIQKNKFSKQQREKQRVSGISVEISKVYNYLEDIRDNFKERAKNKRKVTEKKK